jgi:DNA repair protein RadC
MMPQRIVEASALLGLRMLDHIIVSDTRHYSFLDAGELGDRS